jgi:hypothetical protein
MQVPEAAPGDITDLLGPILAAKSWEDLQAKDGLPSSKTLAQTGHRIRVDSVARKLSDMDVLGDSYLLCEGTDLTTGEVIRFTAGGAECVAKLSTLYILGDLPAFVEFVPVDLPDKKQAINCHVLGGDPSKIIDA